MLFFVDYENVRTYDGLEGIKKLKKDDCVYIIYTDYADAIEISKLVNHKCKIKFLKAVHDVKSSADFALVMSLGLLMKKKEKCYIVSKDKGFLAAIEMAKSLGYTNIKRIEYIGDAMGKTKSNKKNTVTEMKKPLVEAAVNTTIKKPSIEDFLKEVKLTANEKEILKSAFPTAHKRNGGGCDELHTCLVHELGNEKGRELYFKAKGSYQKYIETAI